MQQCASSYKADSRGVIYIEILFGRTRTWPEICFVVTFGIDDPSDCACTFTTDIMHLGLETLSNTGAQVDILSKQVAGAKIPTVTRPVLNAYLPLKKRCGN